MEDRLQCEAMVLSCIYQDLTLVQEVNDDYFSDDSTVFFYILAREMSKSIKEVDTLSVNSFISSNGLGEVFKSYGGYDRIKNLLNLKCNCDNFEGYVDALRKHVIVSQSTDMGIDLNRKYKINHEEVIPMEVLPFCDAVQFSGLIQSIILENVGINVVNTNDKLESLHYTDEEIEAKENGIANDTAYFDITMRYNDVENGEERYISSFKLLNNELDGLSRKNGIHFIGASSGSGKTTVTLQMVMGLIESGEKVLIVSNEQQSVYFKNLLLSYVCVHVFKCYTISRKKINKWTLTDEEKTIFKMANQFIKDKYEGRLTFWAVSEFDIKKIENKMLKLKMTEGYSYMVLDTLKADLSVGTNVTNEYVNLSRELDSFGRKKDIGVIAPIQLLSSTERVSFLTASQISSGKQIKEIASSVVLFRKCKNNIELDQENKQYFLKPYRWEKNKISGRYEKKYLKIIDSTNASEKKYEYDKNCIDINKQYRVFIIDKNRSGSDGIVYLYSFDGNTGRISEVGICDHINLGYLSQG